jgi:hypothetical protein
MTVATHDTGLALAERYRVSIDDAMILAAALQAGCQRFWSEDMQHGMTLDEGPRILNPFRLTAYHARHIGGVMTCRSHASASDARPACASA